jgi:hypothetical protein
MSVSYNVSTKVQEESNILTVESGYRSDIKKAV